MAALGEPLLMTVDQFQALPERQDVLEELHWGQLVTLSRPKAWHVKLQMKLTHLLQPLAGDRGYVVMECPFRAVSEYDLRAADVAFVSKERWDQVTEYLTGAPEIVIEILSPSNNPAQIREFMALCLANGCQEFWTIEYQSKSVAITAGGGQPLRYSTGMKIPLKVFGNETVTVDEIFA